MFQFLNLKLWAIILLVSAVGVLAKLGYYYVGKRGKDAVLGRVPTLTPERLEEINLRYETQGSRVLLLSSIPGIGSALTAVAGIVGIKLLSFVFWVAVSTLIRNSLLVLVFGQTLSLFSNGGS